MWGNKKEEVIKGGPYTSRSTGGWRRERQSWRQAQGTRKRGLLGWREPWLSGLSPHAPEEHDSLPKVTALILQERHTEGGHNAGRAWAGRWTLTFPVPSPQKLLLGLTYFGGPLPCSSWASRFLQVSTEVPTPSPSSLRPVFGCPHLGGLPRPLYIRSAGTTPPLLTSGNGNRDRFTFSFSARYLALPGTREYVRVCPPQDLLTAVPQG